MKPALLPLLLPLAACIAPAAQPVPVSMDGKLVVVNFHNAQEASTEMGEQPKAWKKCTCTPMMMQFPAGGGNTYSYQLIVLGRRFR